jgi:hypothetical protein
VEILQLRPTPAQGHATRQGGINDIRYECTKEHRDGGKT